MSTDDERYERVKAAVDISGINVKDACTIVAEQEGVSVLSVQTSYYRAKRKAERNLNG